VRRPFICSLARRSGRSYQRSGQVERLLLFWIAATLGCSGVIGSASPGAGGGAATGAGGGTPTGGTSSGGASTGGTPTGGSSTGGTMMSGTGSGGSGGSVPADPKAAGLFPLQRLTAREYLNTVRDLLGDTTLTVADVPNEGDDTSNNAFPFRQPTPIATADASSLESAAETVAAHMATKLSTILPCSAATAAAEPGCAAQFINTFGPKIYRRPLTPAEVTDLTALYQAGRTTLSLNFQGAIGFLLEAMLQSPGFIDHWEKDPGPPVMDGAVVQLGNYQTANRLSYFLWGSMPDQSLFAAAAAGQLTTATQIQAQATRMLQDPKAQDTVADFIDDWLDVNTVDTRPKDANVYPMFNADMAAAMETEFRSFGVSVVFGSGLFGDLLGGTHSSVNQALAGVYGVSGISGTAPMPVTFDPTQRAGLLTLAGFLTVTGEANGSDPVRRGHSVLTRLLCGSLPNPPNTVPPVPAPTTGISTRQRFITHDQNSCTGGCHNVMDPIGFGFEHYDGIGAFRTMDPDSKTAIDATGTVLLDGQTQAFPDALTLAGMLAKSPEVQACFSTQWVRYALNRWDTPADAASIQAATTAFQTSGLNIPALMIATATSRTFRYRTPDTGEVLQ
jgi:Protein of unknown function (DUF1592)/Protein of unknown function (DUF1588)/Protein of unknown function (DUF1595)/Protein of unknown function (DUF1585)/Protein of unknown function (DUF1587)